MSGTRISPGEPTLQAGSPRDGVAQPQDALRNEVAQLHEALRSQRHIGMAVGLVSARFGCSTEQAWRTLVRVSQDSNIKVRTVAQVLVATHDGTAGDEERELLRGFVGQLPASGWPAGASVGEDPPHEHR